MVALLEILEIVQASAAAAPLLAKLVQMAKSGATPEQVLEAARNFAVTSESDAQAAINSKK
jgi:hypothetical protein